MKIEDEVAAVPDGAIALVSSLGQPVVAYHLTAIMRESDIAQAEEMQGAFLRRSVEALVADGLEDAAAERFASSLVGRVGSAWKLVHAADANRH